MLLTAGAGHTRPGSDRAAGQQEPGPGGRAAGAGSWQRVADAQGQQEPAYERISDAWLAGGEFNTMLGDTLLDGIITQTPPA